MSIKAPQKVKPRSYQNADKAVQSVMAIYEDQTRYLKESFERFRAGKIPSQRVSAYYPYVKLNTTGPKDVDRRRSYGFVPDEGEYATTLTRPDIFEFYFQEQFRLLLKNHEGDLEIGVSDTPIPLHFALGEDFHLEKDLSEEQVTALPIVFDQPDLSIMDDQIANATYVPREGEPTPLSLFIAPRVDVSLMRLKHYTGTNSKDFQNFVIFTNYQFYVEEFIKIGRSKVGADGYTDFVGADVSRRIPQMPAYHLKREDGQGITLINIGVGPSNAKTITDHVAVLRPHAWLMLGHCAGLRNSQKMGDYVLAHAYLREDNILYKDLNPSIPVPALSEIQQSLAQAVSEVTGLKAYDLKKIMRTGTVATVDDRNWELRPSIRQNQRFSQSRAIALDMESGTIAANGFRFRVPYGTLLCISDKPLHGQLKLPGMADTFYRERVDQHLHIGLRAMEILREIGPEELHSRKLRSFNEVAFQ